MDRLLGKNYALLTSERLSSARIENQKNTLKGFAEFLVQAWNHPQQVPTSTMEKTRVVYQRKIDQLSRSLPARYANLLANCKAGLNYVFSSQIPWTLSHGDLCDTNILVNPETSELTSIVDWAESSIVPFGFSLWSLETFLGFMDVSNHCWSYYEGRKQLEAVFWESLESNIGPLSPDQIKGIQTARPLGLFCRHAFKFNGVEEVPKDETWDLSLLDGQLLFDETRWSNLKDTYREQNS